MINFARTFRTFTLVKRFYVPDEQVMGTFP